MTTVQAQHRQLVRLPIPQVRTRRAGLQNPEHRQAPAWADDPEAVWNPSSATANILRRLECHRQESVLWRRREVAEQHLRHAFHRPATFLRVRCGRQRSDASDQRQQIPDPGPRNGFRLPPGHSGRAEPNTHGPAELDKPAVGELASRRAELGWHAA